ncbi:MAG: sulfurase [Acidocella sp. 20-63-7]|nr:MAG: sulfurase [Acidocella sp. 20-63-7]HQT45805.1 MOSC domain-containing protein [Acidocella sp.]
MEKIQIESLYRYPVKGLTPEAVGRVALRAGQCLDWDRAFALAHGDAPLDPANPQWLAKSHFMCLLRNAGIARLRVRFDEAVGVLHIALPGEGEVSASPFTRQGRAALGAFLVGVLGAQARSGAEGQPPVFRYFERHHFTDEKEQLVSLIGLESLAALEAAVGGAREKLRFRANVYLRGGAPWAEFGWVGRRLRVGTAVLEVTERIGRCGATSVNPLTGERDANPVKELFRHFGHTDLGVFARVIEGGEVRAGNVVAAL